MDEGLRGERHAVEGEDEAPAFPESGQDAVVPDLRRGDLVLRHVANVGGTSIVSHAGSVVRFEKRISDAKPPPRSSSPARRMVRWKEVIAPGRSVGDDSAPPWIARAGHLDDGSAPGDSSPSWRARRSRVNSQNFPPTMSARRLVM